VSNRSSAQMLAAVLVAAGLLVGTLWHVPYVVLSPGPVYNVLGSQDGQQLITVAGAPTYPTDGQLDLTTVSESGGPHGRVPLTRVLGGWFDPAVDVVPTVLLYPPGETSQNVQQENTEEMLQSQDSATIAALRHLGIPVTLVVEVGQVEPGAPAEGKLQPGDQIVSVDGTPVGTGAELRTAIEKHKPGESVSLAIVRDGNPMDVTVVTGASAPQPGQPTTAVIGIVPKDSYRSPVTVTIRLQNVGGPSAGLMFSIGIVDKLTPGQENGGAHVAGTGTIDVNGQVGAIGGIQQKMAGARADGATIFLVPAPNCAEALQNHPAGLQLVKVTTLDDALSGMASAVAGRPAPACSS
jgi:Lon-like protease